MSLRVRSKDGWTSDLLHLPEAEALAKEHPGSVIFQEPVRHPRVSQDPRHRLNRMGETVEELAKRLEREVWGLGL